MKTLLPHQKRVYIIRHCDKPSNYHEEGPSHPLACLCSPQGYMRAALLPRFWEKKVRKGKLDPTNLLLMASNFSSSERVNSCSCEQREMLVLMPTQAFFQSQIQTPFCFTQIEESAKFIMNHIGDVIVAWEHHHIPILASSLGLGSLGNWPNDRFDIVFEITLQLLNGVEYGNPILEITTEKLGLPGDSLELPLAYQPFQKQKGCKIRFWMFVLAGILLVCWIYYF